MKAASSSGRTPFLLVCGTLCAALFAGGCFGSSDGLDPPLDSFYYPSALVVSPGRTALYVANSDYDLQYNGGTVLAIDLSGVRATVSHIIGAMNAGQGATGACAAAGLDTNRSATLHPGPCEPLSVKPLIRRRAVIGAFASSAILVQNPFGPGAHLFVPVRGDPSITYFEVPDDTEPGAFGGCPASGFCLNCGVGDGERCPVAFRIGEDPNSNPRGLTLPPEPVGIAASEDGEAIVVPHLMDQALSLIVDPWETIQAICPPGPREPNVKCRPALMYYASNAAIGPTEVAALPVPAVVRERSIEYLPGFMLTYRAAAQLDLFRYVDDKLAAPDRPFLSRVGAISINTNAGGNDSRGIAIDAHERKACEADCSIAGSSGAPAFGDCLRECAHIPLRLYVANRTPASLLVGQIRAEFTDPNEMAAYDVPSLHESYPLAVGASKVVMGEIIDRTGARAWRVFTVAFDSRLIFSYDPDARRFDAIIHTGRGPHAIAFDTGDDDPSTPGEDERYSQLYVGHFTDSYVGVVDLDMRHSKTFGSMVLTLGVPKAPESSE